MANDVITIEIRASGDDAANALERINAALKDTTGAADAASGGFSDFQAAIVTAREGLALAEEWLRKVRDVLIDSTLKWAEQVTELSHHAEALGISVQALDTLNQASYLLTGQTDLVATSMQRLERALGQAAAAGGPTAQAIEDLGISLSDLLALPTDQQFAAIIERLGQLPDPSQRARDAMLLFNRSWQELIPLMADGGKGLADAMDKADEYGRHLTPGAIQASKDLTLASRELSLAWDNLTTRTAPLLNALTGILQFLTGILEKLTAIKNTAPGAFDWNAGTGLPSTQLPGGGGGTSNTGTGQDDFNTSFTSLVDSTKILVDKFNAVAIATQEFRDAESRALAAALSEEGWLNKMSVVLADNIEATSSVSVEWDQFASNNTQSIADMLEAQDSYTKTMDSSAKTADRLILHGLMPSVSAAVSGFDSMTNLFNKDFGEGGEFSKMFNELGTSFGEFITTLGGLKTSTEDAVKEGLGGAGGSTVDTSGSAIDGSIMSGAIGAALAILMSNPEMQAMMKRLNDLLQGLITPIVESLAPALDAIAPLMTELKPVFQIIGQVLKEEMRPLVEEIKLLTGALREIKNALESIKGPIENIGKQLEAPLKLFGDNIQSLFGPSSGLFQVFQGIGHGVDQLDNLINPFMNSLADLTNVVGPLLDPIRLVRDALNSLTGPIQDILQPIKDLVNAIKNFNPFSGGVGGGGGHGGIDVGPIHISYADGGLITPDRMMGYDPSTGAGLILAHAGETVVPRGGTSNTANNAFTFNINAMNPADMKTQMRAFFEELAMTGKFGVAMAGGR